jgi:hypothetical protein
MNINNLKILADYLESLPVGYEDFDMGVFAKDEFGEELPPTAHQPCGTSMCAVGHGPNAGLAPLETEDDWSKYAERVFGEPWFYRNMDWCFSGVWDGSYPTMDHAIRRLRYVIKHGRAPNLFNKHNHDAYASF